jgi:hypothetical protein
VFQKASRLRKVAVKRQTVLELSLVVYPNVAQKRWQDCGKPLPVKNLHHIEEFDEEITNGEVKDRAYFRPSFLPSGFCNIGVYLNFSELNL